MLHVIFGKIAPKMVKKWENNAENKAFLQDVLQILRYLYKLNYILVWGQIQKG